jgi:flagellar biogenesis protein FliO
MSLSLASPGFLVTTGASTSTTAPTSNAAHTVSAWSLLGQLVIGLAVILFIILVATRLLRGKGGRLAGVGRRQMLVSVIARQSMGKGVSVVIVRAGTATYLLGVTQHQVTRLDQLDPGSLSVPGDSDPDRPSMSDHASLMAPEQDWPTNGWGSFVRKLQNRSVRR